MGPQKAVPGGGFAADRSGIQAVAVADVVDGRITDAESGIIQGPNHTIASPSRIFLDQFEDEFFQFRIHRRWRNAPRAAVL